MSTPNAESNPGTLTIHHRTTNPYESLFGYSRAVRKGPFIFVSGTTALDLQSNTPTILHPTDAYQQAAHIFAEIKKAVESLGGTHHDIVRVRMYLTHDEDSGDVAKALKEAGVGGEGGPAATLLIGNRFAHPGMRVEIEADAVVL